MKTFVLEFPERVANSLPDRVRWTIDRYSLPGRRDWFVWKSGPESGQAFYRAEFREQDREAVEEALGARAPSGGSGSSAKT